LAIDWHPLVARIEPLWYNSSHITARMVN